MLIATTFLFKSDTFLGGIVGALILVIVGGILGGSGNGVLGFYRNWKVLAVVALIGYTGGQVGTAASDASAHNDSVKSANFVRAASADLRSEHFSFTGLEGYDKSVILLLGRCRVVAQVAWLPSRHDPVKKWRPTVFDGHTGLEASDLPALAQICPH